MINRLKNLFKPTGKMSDGYHTFDELYDHRIALFLELCRFRRHEVWYSFRHSDGKLAFGGKYVVVGIG